MKTSLFLVIVLHLVCSPAARSQTLWQGTTYGMSFEEARRTLPLAAPPTGRPSRLGNQAEERLRVENYEVAHQRFSVSLFFLKGRLHQVTLSLKDRLPFGATMLVFDQLADAMRSKYGREVTDRLQTTGSLRTRNAEWISGRTNINLFALTQDDTPATFNVNYQVRLAGIADKL